MKPDPKFLYGGQRVVAEEDIRQQALARDITRWDEITDVSLLRKVMADRFYVAVSTNRWLRMTATPLQLKSDRVNTGDDNLRMMIQFQRRAGI